MLRDKRFSTSGSILKLPTRLLCSFSLFLLGASAADTALDRYVKKPDPAYQWTAVGTTQAGGVSVSLLDMTSQTWRTEKEVDKPVWKHWINVYRPANAKPGIAMLFISGGNNERRDKPGPDPMLLSIAKETGVVIADLKGIPSEPLYFKDEDNKRRNEDGIIAYTWDKHLRGGDDEWPLRLPMTKASVRAMDSVTAFLKSKDGGELAVDRFIVAGASKRGWTTWTTAAVDKRVIAIAPMVIDLLNMVPSFIHHWRAYGFWAPAIQDYTDIRMQEWFLTKEFKKLMKIEEPWEYRDRLTMPKLIINSAGDDFFLPDSSQFYWDGLKGEKHLRYVPNTRHNLSPSDVPQTLAAFIDSVVTNKPRPDFNWKINKKDSSIDIEVKDKPKEIRLWQINNPNARDFRLTTTGPKWTSEVITPVNGKYKALPSKPAKGYTAFFVEFTYESGIKFPHKFTTGVSVTPNTYPFPAPKPGDGLPPKPAAKK